MGFLVALAWMGFLVALAVEKLSLCCSLWGVGEVSSGVSCGEAIFL